MPQETKTGNLHEVKRAQICHVLANQEWDYYYDNQEQLFFKDVLKEFFLWKGKGRDYEPAIFNLTMERLAEEAGVSFSQLAKVKTIASQLEDQKIYSRMKNEKYYMSPGVCDVKISIPLKNGGELSDNLLFFQKSAQITFIYFNLNQFNDKDSLTNSLEFRLTAAWWDTLTIKTKYLVLVNFSLRKKLEITNFSVHPAYVESSKDILSKMMISPEDKIPVSEICINCYNRTVCPFTRTKQKRISASLLPGGLDGIDHIGP